VSDGALRTILFRLQSDFGPLSYCAQFAAALKDLSGRPEEDQCCDGAVQESLNTVRAELTLGERERNAWRK
jgi:hypothetical protein